MLTADGETRVLDGLLNAVYLGLHTGDPTLGSNEVTGGGYARQAYVYSNTGTDPKTAGNTGTIQFPTATAAWGTITHVGIWSASSAGTLLASAPLADPKAVDIDDVFRFLANKMQVTAD